MGHNPGTATVKKVERKQAQEARTPEEILKGIRGNLTAKLAVTPSDTQRLLDAYDAAKAHNIQLLTVNGDLLRKVGEQVEQNQFLNFEVSALNQKLAKKDSIIAGISDQLSELQHIPPRVSANV